MRLDGPVELAEGMLPQADRPDGKNAASFAHDYLKTLILDLTLAPGILITEMDVARATGLSRTPIREALLRLHEERLVELLPRRGALIPRITARQVRELYEMRLLLESHAVRVICTERIPVASQLLSLCQEQARLDAQGASPPELIRVDRAFHSMLIAAAGNTVMATVNESLGDHHQRTGVLSFSLDATRRQVAVDQHREIADALAAFDLPVVQEIIERHLVIGERQFERMLRD